MKRKLSRTLMPGISIEKEHAESFFVNHVESVSIRIFCGPRGVIDYESPLMEVFNTSHSLDELYVHLLDLLYQFYQCYLMGVDFGYSYDVVISIRPKVGSLFTVRFPLI